MQIPPDQKHILIVDDDFSVLTVIKAMLESSDYNVAGARTADVAVSIAERKNKLDLLLTDVVMPDVDGPHLAEKILTIQTNARVIFMSGYPLKTYDAENLAHVGFLPKPFDSRKLLDAIELAFGVELQISVARSSTIFSFWTQGRMVKEFMRRRYNIWGDRRGVLGTTPPGCAIGVLIDAGQNRHYASGSATLLLIVEAVGW